MRTRCEAAEISRALNTPLENIVTLMGLFGQNLDNLDGSQILELFNVITAIGNVGSIDAGSLSQSLAPNIGEFARATGIEDPVELAAGVARMGTLIKQGGQSDSETSTMMSSLLRSVNDSEVVRRYNRATGRRGNASPFHEGGDINGRLNLDMLIGALGDEKLDRSTIASIFTNQTSLGAAGVIRDASTNETLMRDMNSATAADGAAFIADVNAGFDAETFGRMEHRRAQNLATFNPDNAFTNALEDAAGYFSELEAEFPAVIGGLNIFGEALKGIGGALMGGQMLGLLGGGAAAAGGAAGGAAALTAAITALPVLIAGAVGGAIGTYINTLMEDEDGKGIGEQLYEWVHDDEIPTTSERGLGDTRVYADGRVVTVRMDSDTTRAMGDATASALKLSDATPRRRRRTTRGLSDADYQLRRGAHLCRHPGHTEPADTRIPRNHRRRHAALAACALRAGDRSLPGPGSAGATAPRSGQPMERGGCRRTRSRVLPPLDPSCHRGGCVPRRGHHRRYARAALRQPRGGGRAQ